MSAAIGKLPKGLMALLALRNHGEAPQLLADQLVATTDLMSLYLLDTRERSETLTEAAPAVGANNFSVGNAVVPAGELWYVWQFALVLAPGVGEAIAAAPAVLLDGNGLMAPVGRTEVVLASEHARPYNDFPFWAGPGSTLGFIVRSVTGAPPVNAAAIITRLRV